MTNTNREISKFASMISKIIYKLVCAPTTTRCGFLRKSFVSQFLTRFAGIGAVIEINIKYDDLSLCARQKKSVHLSLKQL